MSRDDPYKPPVIRPALLKRWREYKKKWFTEFYTAHKVYKDRGREVPFEPMHRWARFYKEDPPRKLNWEEESLEGSRVDTARWEVGRFKLVARQLWSTEMAELDGLGEFTSKDETTYPDKLGVWARGLKQHHHSLKGHDDRHRWREGFYDRSLGGTTGVDRNKHKYIQLDDYDYVEERNMWWLLGYSKFEADILARRAFKSRIEYMEGIDQEPVNDLSVKVYLVTDEDEEDELAHEISGPLLSYTEGSFTELAFEMEERVLDEARQTIDRRIAAYQPMLPNVALEK